MRKTFDCYFGIVGQPKALEDGPEKERMVQELRDGNKEMIQPLILGHVGMLLSMAIHTAKRWQGRIHQDDLLLEALVNVNQTLVDIAEKRRELRNNNIAPYIRVIAQHSMTDHLSLIIDGVIGVPKATQSTNGEEPPKIGHTGHLRKTDFRNQFSMMEIRDVLETIAKDPIDRLVLEYREKGFSDREIAAALGVATSTVWNIRKELERRYELASRIRESTTESA